MKEAILIIGALALSGVLARAADFRNVGGRWVDLQPIHDWEDSGGQDERPLKHWKEVQIVGWVAQGPHGHPVATLRISNAEPKDVWLKNCPRQVIQDLARLAELEQQASFAQEQATTAANWAEIERNRPAWGGYLVATDPGVLNAWSARMRANAYASTYLAAAAEKAATNLTQLRARLAREAKLLAMDTGFVYGSMPIWDTGLTGR